MANYFSDCEYLEKQIKKETEESQNNILVTSLFLDPKTRF